MTVHTDEPRRLSIDELRTLRVRRNGDGLEAHVEAQEEAGLAPRAPA